MKRFIGIWQNKSGNTLIIKEESKGKALVTFISGKTNEPVERAYADNKLSIDMDAELDFYETSVEIELWEKGKGFHLCLTDDDYLTKAEELSVGISRYSGDEYKFLEKYYYLFEPISSYKRKKENKEGRQ